jgi:hypothetical protein
MYNYTYVLGCKTTSTPVITFYLDTLDVPYDEFMNIFYASPYFNVNPAYRTTSQITFNDQTYSNDSSGTPPAQAIPFRLLPSVLKGYSVFGGNVNNISPVDLMLAQKQTAQDTSLYSIHGTSYSLSWDEVWAQLINAGYSYIQDSTTTVLFSILVTYLCPTLKTEIIIQMNYRVPVLHLAPSAPSAPVDPSV